MAANHGGGYMYRLCKKKPGGNKLLTEECFQQIPLEFVGDKQWVQFGPNEKTRFEFKADRTNQGTTPAGSTWTKNPIPAYNCPSGGALGHAFDGISANHHGCTKPQFPPPRADLVGFGYHAKDTSNKFALKFAIVDKLRVPDNIPSGEYVLSFRWDVEQTDQVWNTCADIVVTQKAAKNAGGGTCPLCRGKHKLHKNLVAGIHEGTPYSCEDAQAVLKMYAGRPKCDALSKYWSPTCCKPWHPSCNICEDPKALIPNQICAFNEGHATSCKEAQESLHGKSKEECKINVSLWRTLCCGRHKLEDYRRLAGINATFV